MLLKSSRRTRWYRLLRNVFLVLVFICFLDFSLILRRHRIFDQNLVAQIVTTRNDLPLRVQQHKIFVAAQFWSSEELLKNHWISAFDRLIRALGPENIYVSILSSRGLDNTEDAIHQLDARLAELGVSRSVVIDSTTHEEIVSSASEDSHGNPKPGWVVTDRDKPDVRERRRIPYLSGLRNRALDVLQDLKDSGQIFDRILYLNDVIFEPRDILTLLATNNGEFDVACGLDFHLPPALYDTFAIRDTSLRGPITSIFPYFTHSLTRNSMLAGLASPVSSCWNGVVAADAGPYYNHTLDKITNQVHKGLRFREIPDKLAAYYLEASECCLIHADLAASGQALRGIYVNPAVRTAYTADAYEATHTGPSASAFVTRWQYWSGVWVTRVRHWWTDAVSISAGQKTAEVKRRIGLWKQEADDEPKIEVGEHCVTLEMQILISNGWKHVQNDIPSHDSDKGWF